MHYILLPLKSCEFSVRNNKVQRFYLQPAAALWALKYIVVDFCF